MDADDVRVKEAAERYRANAYAPGHFGEPEYRNLGYLTGADGWEDRVILSNAYVALADAGRASGGEPDGGARECKCGCPGPGGEFVCFYEASNVPGGRCVCPCHTPGSSSGVADGATFAEQYGAGQAKDHYDTADLVTAFEAGKACQRAAGGEAERQEVCQVCGQQHPPRYLFDLKGNVLGGRKVTCPTCCNTLDEAEIGRLRATLEEFAQRDCNCDVTKPKGYQCVRCKARAALGGGAGRGT